MAAPSKDQKHNTLLIVDRGFHTGRVFGSLFSASMIFQHMGQVSKDCVVVFEGGTDVSPNLYNAKRNEMTEPSDNNRDALEAAIFKRAVAVGAGIVGVCRGAQLGCVLSGGSLIQHVTNHNQNHKVFLPELESSPVPKAWQDIEIDVTSCHHQMMWPFDLPENEFTLLGYTAHQADHSRCYFEEESETVRIPPHEVEFGFFKKTRCLVIQGHPEWANISGQFAEYSRQLVSAFLLK